MKVERIYILISLIEKRKSTANTFYSIQYYKFFKSVCLNFNATISDAEDAINELDGGTLNGEIVSVNYAVAYNSERVIRNRIYIGQLPESTQEPDLRKFLHGFGEIKEILLMRGFAFIEFEEERSISKFKQTDVF